MKICHVITRFIAGGAQENTLATVHGLAANGHDVTLVSGPSTGPEGSLFDFYPHDASYPSFRFIEEPHLVRPIHPYHDIRAYCNLKRLFESERFDVIHTHSSKAGVIGRLAARETRRNHNTTVVHTIHGLAFDSFKPAWKNTLYISLERLCAKHSDAIISVCDAMTEQALSAGIGSPDLYSTIYSGFDITSFRTAAMHRDLIRDDLAIPPETCVLLSIGRLFTFKGAEDFITILENLYAEGIRDVTGILVGDGTLRPALERHVRERLPAGAVHFAGLVPPTDIPRWIAVADLVVHASLREGLARVIPQALAVGVPVVSYTVGGAAEVIIDGVNGCLCPPGDVARMTAAVKSFVSDPEMKHALSNGAHVTDLDNFSAGLMAKHIEALYQTLRVDA